jgi:hypothetical protein
MRPTTVACPFGLWWLNRLFLPLPLPLFLPLTLLLFLPSLLQLSLPVLLFVIPKGSAVVLAFVVALVVAVAVVLCRCPFVCHSAAKRRNLLLSLLLPLFVFAVILSEAKDPEAPHPRIPLEPFNPLFPHPPVKPQTQENPRQTSTIAWRTSYPHPLYWIQSIEKPRDACPGAFL